ncbi:MAG TPA: hypothetical protein PLI93_10910 [Gemmatimonadales bacterium]|nr:hypothetical protein [Gemmatimonadales bacterium]
MLLGVLRMAPYAVAALRTPPGWEFSGNLTVSPDYMQYRTWARQTQVEGPIVSDRFTAEPTSRFLPVPLYWGIGALAGVTGLTPEWVYAWLGVPLTIAMVLLLYVVIRRFLRDPVAVRWVFWATVLGGGLGALLLLVEETPLRTIHPLYKLFVEPIESPALVIPFERYRGNYVVQALLDTHFLAFWVAATAAMLALVEATLAPARRRLLVMGALFAGATILHVYEGVTLLAITAGVVAVCLRRGLPRRDAAALLATATASVAVVLVGMLLLQRGSGYPTPEWRGLMVAPAILLLAYPVAWLLLAVGGIRFWQEATREGALLVGWVVGCLALVLAGPFFPYPDRGTMTLQIPLMIIAGLIYFRDRSRVRPRDAMLLVLLSAPTLVHRAFNIAGERFDPASAHIWLGPAHRHVLDTLLARATRDDLLVADAVSLRWLGPEYVGRHYAGHFFLTIRYPEKRAALERFLAATDAEAQRAFLAESGATLLFVPAGHDPSRVAALPGVRPLVAESVGTLFAVDTLAIQRPVESSDAG